MFWLILFWIVGNAQAGELWTKYDITESINCITSYSDYIWIGTSSGVTKMNRNDGTLKKYTMADSLLKNNIDFIAADTYGNIFTGSKDTTNYTNGNYSGGISIYNGVSWNTYTKGTDGLAG